jgi:two-component system invasion response regulator UvrY
MKKILIVDDHEVVRAGVMRILDEDGTVFGEASNLSQALQMVREQPWDLVVLDLSLGERSGLEVLRELKQIRQTLGVLILSMHSEEQYARRAFKSGAAGYITKDSPREELVIAAHKVMQGGRYVGPAIAERLAEGLDKDTEQPLHRALSNREFEVMCLIASGKSVGEIASLLSLSDKTISTYRARVLEKMGMKTTAEIMHYAIRNKLAS